MKSFNDFSPFSALDIVLKVIYETDTAMWGIDIDQIYNQLTDSEGTHFAFQEIEILLNQLIIDRNIEPIGNGKFKLSLAGRFLHLSHGYSQKEILRVADEAHLKLLRNQQAQQGKAQVRLTCILAVAATIASVYYLIEVWKWANAE